jgi:fructoselysine-6-P-deglycase FrlB-like protein
MEKLEATWMNIEQTVARIIEERKNEGDIENVFFTACGGSLAAFYPAKTFLETEAKQLRTGWFNANEFVHNPPAALGPNTVVVSASQGGNTPETIEAIKTARKEGARVIGLTWTPDSELTQNSDYMLGYTFGDDRDVTEEKTMVGLRIAAELLQQTEGYDCYTQFYDGVAKIDGIVKRACAHVEKRAEAFAQEFKNDTFIYTIGSGASWSSAYMESICILMEMQWINSACIHAGEYFHGPFEVTDANTGFILQVAEGKTRPLDERVLRFLQRYAKRYEVLDAKELGLSTIDSSVVDYFNHSLFNNVYSVYNRKLSEARQHPLSTRRYMWKVSY